MLSVCFACRRRRVGAACPIAGQKAAGERAPGNHADAFVPAEREHLALFLAVDEVVVILHGDEPRPAVQVGEIERPARTATRTCWRRRCTAPCRSARRRGAPGASLRWASRDPSDESGRGRRSRSAAASATDRSTLMMCFRDSPRSFGSSLIGLNTLVAITTLSRCAKSRNARPSTSSLAPSEYMSAVSKKLMPCSSDRLMNGRPASSGSTHARHFGSPYVMAPRHRRETFSPDDPSRTYCIS